MTLAQRQAYQRQQRADVERCAPALHEVLIGEPRCVICGCSESIACPGGCTWVTLDLCSACVADRASVAALGELLAAAAKTLLGVAAHATRVLKDTDGSWPPAARAADARRGLQHIEAECRRVHAAVTTNDEEAGK